MPCWQAFLFMSKQEKIEFADSVLECLKKHNSESSVENFILFVQSKGWENSEDGIGLRIFGYAQSSGVV